MNQRRIEGVAKTLNEQKGNFQGVQILVERKLPVVLLLKCYQTLVYYFQLYGIIKLALAVQMQISWLWRGYKNYHWF